MDSPGDEFLRKISNFKTKRKINLSPGDSDSNEMYQKCDARVKLLFCPSKLLLFRSSRCISHRDVENSLVVESEELTQAQMVL